MYLITLSGPKANGKGFICFVLFCPQSLKKGKPSLHIVPFKFYIYILYMINVYGGF